MNRYVCIHGHFYQPPRENPWLEDIELQNSAHPYHDWNERITDQCYAPNAASRILNNQGQIEKIVNNYAKISFNFGPTLLDWMEKKEPEVYQAILAADEESKKYFSGHGSALAQCYNHIIMPLASQRDKYTQIAWGIEDFKSRFGRDPEGMWLPETAVDMESLKIMAEQGIKFTILTPYQAWQVRETSSGVWHHIEDRGIDPSMPYHIDLPGSNQNMSIFFYDGPISQAVAFENLLSNGERFSQRLLQGFDEQRDTPQLVNISTDGETYGHHHQYGDMALSYALHYIESNNLAQITNYGEYLEKHHPTREVKIVENSSWSCAHGVERWRSNCGCNSNMKPGWQQKWRAPLRISLDWLRKGITPSFEEYGKILLKDPWKARNDYILVVLDRSPQNVEQFLDKHAAHKLKPEERITVLKLLEMQRHAMLMYTSCGWFFDDISGIETIQIIRYAGRVIQLAEEVFGEKLEPKFLELLKEAPSNVPKQRNGAHIYKKSVKPAMVDLPRLGAHYAISSLFENYNSCSRIANIYCYLVEPEDHHYLNMGDTKLVAGKIRVTSEITREWVVLTYGVLYFGYHNVNGGVRTFTSQEDYQKLIDELAGAFDRGDLARVILVLSRHFEDMIYSVKQLFGDQQRKILDIILDSTLERVNMDYYHIYNRHASLMRFLKDIDVPQPKALNTAAEYVLNNSLRQALQKEQPDFKRIKSLLDKIRKLDVPLNKVELTYTLKHTIEKMAERLNDQPQDLLILENLKRLVSLAHSLPLHVDMWKVQNIYYQLLNSFYSRFEKDAKQGRQDAGQWVKHFINLGEKLQMRRGI